MPVQQDVPPGRRRHLRDQRQRLDIATLRSISGNRRMAAQRVAMRNIKECLRLKFEADLSHEKIARALQLSKGVVSKYIKAARDTGIDWPALALLDEVALGAP